MRIDTSTISMASTRSFLEEAAYTQTAVKRLYGADGEVTRTSASSMDIRRRRFAASGGVAQYQTSALGSGVQERADDGLQSTREKAEPPAAQEQPQAAAVAAVPQTSGSDWLSGLSSLPEDPIVTLLRRCLELLERATGKKVNSHTRLGGRRLSETLGLSVSTVSARYQKTMSLLPGPAIRLSPEPAAAPNGTWTRQVVQSGFVSGEEHTAFTSRGTVVTSDGRSIDFGIQVEMSRSYEKAFVAEGKEAIYTDPLVINLDTDAAALSDVSFYFDLDCDGTEEEISTLAQGSGFLALDRNGDGKINDGSELFGAKSGDGFADLAAYDQDGNGWIDENDAVFSRLSVWTKCGDGEAKLLSLKEAGVGAIFLGSQATQFGLSNSSQEDVGVIRRTGLYLKESGEAGTVQHLDFKT